MKDVYKLLDGIDHHARAVTRLTVELRTVLAGMSITPAPDDQGWTCPCGSTFKTEYAFALHRQNVHSGPAVPLAPHEIDS